MAVLLQAWVLMATPQVPQQPGATAPQVQSKPQFFAGSVSALSARAITVSRHVVGHNAAYRTFLIDSKTKMPRSNLRVKSRVTVRFVHSDGGDLALAVKLQPAPRPAHNQ